MSSFGYNLSQDYQIMQFHQQQMRREMASGRQTRDAMTATHTERRFRRMYRLRRVLFLLAPGLAARLLV